MLKLMLHLLNNTTLDNKSDKNVVFVIQEFLLKNIKDRKIKYTVG
jgi:hypothetical protein